MPSMQVRVKTGRYCARMLEENNTSYVASGIITLISS